MKQRTAKVFKSILHRYVYVSETAQQTPKEFASHIWLNTMQGKKIPRLVMQNKKLNHDLLQRGKPPLQNELWKSK